MSTQVLGWGRLENGDLWYIVDDYAIVPKKGKPYSVTVEGRTYLAECVAITRHVMDRRQEIKPNQEVPADAWEAWKVEMRECDKH